METADFCQALYAADQALLEGARVLVYAVSGEQSALLPQPRWQHFVKLWLERRP